MLPRTSMPLAGLAGHGHWNGSLYENPEWDFVNRSLWFYFDPGAQDLPGSESNVHLAKDINPTYWNVAGGRRKIAPSLNPNTDPKWRSHVYGLTSRGVSQHETSIHQEIARIQYSHDGNSMALPSYFVWEAAGGTQAGAAQYPSGATFGLNTTVAASVFIGNGGNWPVTKNICNVGIEMGFDRDFVTGPRLFWAASPVGSGFVSIPNLAGNLVGRHTVVYVTDDAGIRFYWDGQLVGSDPTTHNQLAAPAQVFVATSQNVVTPRERGAWRGSVDLVVWCAESSWSGEQVARWHEEPYAFAERVIPVAPRIVVIQGVACIAASTEVVARVRASTSVCRRIDAASDALPAILASTESNRRVSARAEVCEKGA